MAEKLVPVTLISGFVGAGKTTLVGQLRDQLSARPVAYLQNFEDESLFEEINDALENRSANLIIIERECHDEPFLAAESLEEGYDDLAPPEGIKLDTLVTVVDASRFLKDILSPEDLVEVLPDCDPEDDRTVAEVLVEQIEFADVVVLNKIDLSSDRDLNRSLALLYRLNPRARMLTSTMGKVAASNVIETGLFELDATDEGAGWLAELEGGFEELGEVEGVSSFTYTETRPFHPIRFNELLGDLNMKGVVRAKGSIWVASRHHEIGIWMLAGRSSVLSYGGAWFAATPTREWPENEEERAAIMERWVAPFGDRRQEIAFIGCEMNEQEVRERLDDCLLTSQEMKDGPDGWFTIPDPLPDWHEEN